MKIKILSATCCALMIACLSTSMTAQAASATAPNQLAALAQPVDCSAKETKVERKACRVAERKAERVRTRYMNKKNRECKKEARKAIKNGTVPEGTTPVCNVTF